MKSYGKFKRWADEKLGSANARTELTDEFVRLEAEVEVREAGLQAIHGTTIAWIRHLVKRKDSGEKEKAMPLELLGATLLYHADQLAPGSEYKDALQRLGAAQQKIARNDERFAKQLQDEVLDSTARSLVQITEYHQARKKLESKRQTYDVILTKAQKAKKEDTRLDEELRAARIRYEEVLADVLTRMRSIEQSEADSIITIERFIRLSDDRLQYESAVMHNAAMGNASGDLSPAKNDSPTRRRLTVSSVDAAPDQSDSQRIDQSFVQRASTSGASQQRQQRTVSVLEDFYEPGNELSLATIADEESSDERDSSDQASSLVKPIIVAVEKRMVANYDFAGLSHQELSFKSGDVIAVEQEDDSGWWRGRLTDMRGRPCSDSGLFPANYCTPAVDKKRSPPLPLTDRIERDVDVLSIANTCDSPRSMRSVSNSNLSEDGRLNPASSSTDSLTRPSAGRSVTLPLDLNAARLALKSTSGGPAAATRPHATPVQILPRMRNASQSSINLHNDQAHLGSPTPKQQRRRPPPPPAARNASRTSLADLSTTSAHAQEPHSSQPARRSPPRVPLSTRP